jgi:hypothetical protein
LQKPRPKHSFSQTRPLSIAHCALCERFRRVDYFQTIILFTTQLPSKITDELEAQGLEVHEALAPSSPGRNGALISMASET